jgi:putative endonuclease
VKKFVVYMVRTSGNTLYTGQTNDLKKRLLKHQAGTGAKYLRRFDGLELVYSEKFTTRSEAMKREAAIKGMSRVRKEKLMLGGRSGDRS